MLVRKIDYEHIEQALSDYGWLKVTHGEKRIEKHSISGRDIYGYLLDEAILLKYNKDLYYCDFKFKDILSLEIDNYQISVKFKDYGEYCI